MFTQLNLVANPQYLGKERRSEALVLGSTTWMNTTLTYDTWGRATNTAGNNLLNPTVNTAEQMAYTYDWADYKMSERRTHTPGAAGATGTRNLNYTWQYDHAGRQTVYVFGLDGDGFGTQLAEYNYNHRNEMVERNLHANQVAGVWGWLQSIDYGYNAQGWLTAINNWNPTATVNTPAQCAPAMPNPASPARTFYNEANDLLYMDIRYDQLLGISGTSGTIQKAGNISQIAWRARGRETQIYSYGVNHF